MDDFESLLNDIHEDLVDKDLNLESLFITAIHTMNEDTNVNRTIYNSKKEIVDGILGVKKNSNPPPNNSYSDDPQNNSYKEEEDKHQEESKSDEVVNNEDTSLLVTDEVNFDTPEEDDNTNKNFQEGDDIDVTDEDKEDLCHKLYKQIALVCHPDKNKSIVFNKYFIKSKDAYEAKNLLILLYIFYKVSLPYKNIEEKDMKIIKMEIENKQKDIEIKKDHILYKWSQLSDEVKLDYINNVKNRNSNIF